MSGGWWLSLLEGIGGGYECDEVGEVDGMGWERRWG